MIIPSIIIHHRIDILEDKSYDVNLVPGKNNGETKNFCCLFFFF